jgi:DnaK suppressor protein
LLINKLHEILGDVNWIEDEALHKSRQDATGDLSTMPIHMADLGTDNYEQEFSLGLMDSERKIVHEILDALRRIAMGTYGICEGTGKPIPRARLEANPWARYGVEYASRIEQGKGIEKRHSRPLSFEDEEEEGRHSPDRDEDEDTFLEEGHEEEPGEDTSFTGGLPDEEEDDQEEEETF